MRFRCYLCHAKYSIPDEKLRNKILKVRCKRCGTILEVSEAMAAAEPAGDTGARTRTGSWSGVRPTPSQPHATPAVSSPLATMEIEALQLSDLSSTDSRPRSTSGSQQQAGAASFSPRPASPTPATHVASPRASVGATVAPARPEPPPLPDVPWFIGVHGKQEGPLAATQLTARLRRGELDGRVLVWRDGMEGWQRLETLPALAAWLDFARAGRPPVPPPAGPPPLPGSRTGSAPLLRAASAPTPGERPAPGPVSRPGLAAVPGPASRPGLAAVPGPPPAPGTRRPTPSPPSARRPTPPPATAGGVRPLPPPPPGAATGRAATVPEQRAVGTAPRPAPTATGSAPRPAPTATGSAPRPAPTATGSAPRPAPTATGSAPRFVPGSSPGLPTARPSPQPLSAAAAGARAGAGNAPSGRSASPVPRPAVSGPPPGVSPPARPRRPSPEPESVTQPDLPVAAPHPAPAPLPPAKGVAEPPQAPPARPTPPGPAKGGSAPSKAKGGRGKHGGGRKAESAQSNGRRKGNGKSSLPPDPLGQSDAEPTVPSRLAPDLGEGTGDSPVEPPRVLAQPPPGAMLGLHPDLSDLPTVATGLSPGRMAASGEVGRGEPGGGGPSPAPALPGGLPLAPVAHDPARGALLDTVGRPPGPLFPPPEEPRRTRSAELSVMVRLKQENRHTFWAAVIGLPLLVIVLAVVTIVGWRSSWFGGQPAGGIEKRSPATAEVSPTPLVSGPSPLAEAGTGKLSPAEVQAIAALAGTATPASAPSGAPAESATPEGAAQQRRNRAAAGTARGGSARSAAAESGSGTVAPDRTARPATAAPTEPPPPERDPAVAARLAMLEQGRREVRVESPRLTFDAEELPATLGKHEITNVLKSQRKAITRCLERELKKGGTVGRNKIILNFVIRPTGRTESVQFVDAPPDSYFTKCVGKIIDGLHFSRFRGEPIPVSYPLVLTGNP